MVSQCPHTCRHSPPHQAPPQHNRLSLPQSSPRYNLCAVRGIFWFSETCLGFVPSLAPPTGHSRTLGLAMPPSSQSLSIQGLPFKAGGTVKEPLEIANSFNSMFRSLFQTVSSAGQWWHRHLGGRNRQISKTGKAQANPLVCAQLNTLPLYLYRLLFFPARSFMEDLWVPSLVYKASSSKFQRNPV